MAWVSPRLTAEPGRGPTFTYGSAAKRKGRRKDLETSQYFHAKQLTWKVRGLGTW